MHFDCVNGFLNFIKEIIWQTEVIYRCPLSVFKDWKRGFVCSSHMEFVHVLTILFCKSKIESRWELLLSAHIIAQ